MLTISVIIPTYHRPKELERCLEALKKQNRQADEVLVTVRDSDTETWTFLASFDPQPLPLHIIKVSVSVPGVVAAMNMGMDAASGDIIAFTDDDATPHTDWLERMEAHFLSDSNIGGVGHSVRKGGTRSSGTSAVVWQSHRRTSLRGGRSP